MQFGGGHGVNQRAVGIPVQQHHVVLAGLKLFLVPRSFVPS
jgi:hypothetical protein